MDVSAILQNKIWKTKTFWTAVAGVVTAAGTYAAGEASLGQALQTGVTCLMGIFLRMGINK
ncbi:MAG: hypothetical protein HZB23_03530 [Deltaproteobacteria bacterium]|nr:hypothetical protein [Deltaproteobacteria bacterium]